MSTSAQPSMSARKKFQVATALLVIIFLAISTKYTARQLKSFLRVSINNYETPIESVDHSDIIPRKSMKPITGYDRQIGGNGDEMYSRAHGGSREFLAPAQELLEGANKSADWPAENLNVNDQVHADDEFGIKIHESQWNDSISRSRGVAGVDGELNEDETDDKVDDRDYEIGQRDSNNFLGELSPQIKDILRNNTKNINNSEITASPACHPHFNLASPNNQWNDTTKFRRIYLYHARKAGGTSMHRYFKKVAEHYGLELKVMEWDAMEDPGTFGDKATFYVTHLREPVDRSISHFKYQGRWDCKDLIHLGRKFTPTEDNAKNLETWNQTGGHMPLKCRTSQGNNGKRPIFRLGECAINCYVQWFSGLSCSEWGISVNQQYQVAKLKVLKYNFVAVIEKLKDPNYVQAVEDLFGVPGISKRGSPFCQKKSSKANQNVPLIVRNDTRKRLTNLNKLDIKLYHELSNCLDSGPYNFPKWDPNRFELHSYNHTLPRRKQKKKNQV